MAMSDEARGYFGRLSSALTIHTEDVGTRLSAVEAVFATLTGRMDAAEIAAEQRFAALMEQFRMSQSSVAHLQGDVAKLVASYTDLKTQLAAAQAAAQSNDPTATNAALDAMAATIEGALTPTTNLANRTGATPPDTSTDTTAAQDTTQAGSAATS